MIESLASDVALAPQPFHTKNDTIDSLRATGAFYLSTTDTLVRNVTLSGLASNNLGVAITVFTTRMNISHLTVSDAWCRSNWYGAGSVEVVMVVCARAKRAFVRPV